MTPSLLPLALAALLAAQGESDKPRERNPFAPSLPLLTDEEEDKLDALIDRFIAADTGKLAGAEAKQALRDFDRLGPEAIPALIRGANRAAKIESSCPAAMIAKKLHRFLSATRDKELLDFARENLGAGVGRSRHGPMLQDLRVACLVRKAALARLPATAVTAPAERSLRTLPVEELSRLAGSERGDRLKGVVKELGTRRGDEALAALGSAAASYEKDVQQLARDLLDRQLLRETPARVKEKLKDDRAEVRAAAARAAKGKALRVEAELIDLLGDEAEAVRQAAREALVKLSRGADHGPAPGAGPKERAEAMAKWRAALLGGVR